MSAFSIFRRSANKRNSAQQLSSIGPTDQARVIIANIEDGVMLIDPQQNIMLINPAAGLLTGWKPDEATNISADLVLQLVDNKGQLIPKENNPLHQIFNTQQGITTSDYSVLTKDKQSIPVRLHVSPLFDSNKNVTQAVAVMSNISDEKSGEQQRADFISTASHEMRTPVAAIEGYLALSLNENVATIDSRARGYLEKAHSSTQHLGKLFQDLLTSAKAEDGRLTSHPVAIEMGDFVTQLSNDLRMVAEAKGLELDYSVGVIGGQIDATGGEKVISPLFYTIADPDRLREVITNLFDNAVKYTPEGKITMGLTGNDQVVQFFIKDTGLGIPAEDLPHLFQKFYRVDNTATRTIGGTGLGLYICRRIIELYNGKIWAESKLNQGSTFFINLPRITSKRASELQQGTIVNTTATNNTVTPLPS
jgi:PAS domain S-box-containing protein